MSILHNSYVCGASIIVNFYNLCTLNNFLAFLLLLCAQSIKDMTMTSWNENRKWEKSLVDGNWDFSMSSMNTCGGWIRHIHLLSMQFYAISNFISYPPSSPQQWEHFNIKMKLNVIDECAYIKIWFHFPSGIDCQLGDFFY